MNLSRAELRSTRRRRPLERLHRAGPARAARHGGPDSSARSAVPGRRLYKRQAWPVAFCPCPQRRRAQSWGDMHRGTWLGLSILFAALLFQVWVTLRLRRTQIFDGTQKRAQAKLIWLVPVVGAAIVFSVLVSEEQYDKKDDRGQSS
jgi:hypothetical protein